MFLHSYIITCNGEKMVIISHLFFFFQKNSERYGSCKPYLSLFRTAHFPTAPSLNKLTIKQLYKKP